MSKIHRITSIGIFIFPFILLGIFFNNCGKAPATQGVQSSSTVIKDPADVGAKFSGQLNATLQYVGNLGTAWGYASDPLNPSNTLKIIFYIDGPVGVGEYAGETQANIASPGPNSGHFFSFQVPAKFANVVEHVIYAYAVEARPEFLLSPGPLTYQAFTPKAEAVYNQQIKLFVQNNCTKCHNWTYNFLYSGPLLKPLPLKGGSPTNNIFIRKMSGLTGHNGGMFCGGVNDGICLEIQKWWDAEFK